VSQQQPASRTNSRIPVFASRDDEAAWWDSHDLADYQDEFETVEARFADKLSDEDPSRATHAAPERG
jgi:hypothetical protein